MLTLLLNQNYVLFSVRLDQYRELHISEGRKGKRTTRVKKEYLHGCYQTDDALVDDASGLIRRYLDRDYARDTSMDQLDLFPGQNLSGGLFEDYVPEVRIDPLLERAYAHALDLPSSLKWEKVILAGAQICGVCQAHCAGRVIVHLAIASTPAGKVCHLRCQECFAKIK